MSSLAISTTPDPLRAITDTRIANKRREVEARRPENQLANFQQA